MFAGVASAVTSSRANSDPTAAMAAANSSAMLSAVPAIALTLPCSPAPNACPIRMEAPVLRPITKAMKANMTGKNTVTAASASTPIMWPR